MTARHQPRQPFLPLDGDRGEGFVGIGDFEHLLLGVLVAHKFGLLARTLRAGDQKICVVEPIIPHARKI